MNFALDPEQDLIVQTIHKFSDRDLRGWSADADRAATPPDRLTVMASDMGFFLDAVPSANGGLLEGSYSHLTRALRGFQLGRGCAALAALLETNVEPALAVSAWGSAPARQSLFGSLAAGGLATLFHDSRGTLELVAQGSSFRVSGKIGPIPALATASHVLVCAKDIVFLLATDNNDLPPRQGSAMKRDAIAPSGWRAAKWGTVTLAQHEITADFILARDAAARAAITEILTWARASLAARAAGVATAAMEYAGAYAKERVQFGQPIGQFESLIRLRDDALTTAGAARLFALHAAWAIDTKQPNAADLASRARVIAGDAVARATIDAVQIYGGYGFVNDFPVEKLMRDARAFEALHGDERLGRVLAAKGARE